MATQSHYLMVERKYGDSPSHWHPLWEAESLKEAQEALEEMPVIYGEISRMIVSGAASGDCQELRPC
ncbi:hypothetical protein [Pseudomonas sp. S2_H01]